MTHSVRMLKEKGFELISKSCKSVVLIEKRSLRSGYTSFL